MESHLTCLLDYLAGVLNNIFKMKLNTLPCFPNLFWFQTCTSQQLVSSSIWWYIPVIIFDSLPFPPSWDPFSVVHLFLLKRKKKKNLIFLSISSDFRLVQSTITYYVACAAPTLLVSVFTLSNSFCTEWSVWLFANINIRMLLLYIKPSSCCPL